MADTPLPCGAAVVGAAVVGAAVVGAGVVGAGVVGAPVVGAAVVPGSVPGASVVGPAVVGALVLIGPDTAPVYHIWLILHAHIVRCGSVLLQEHSPLHGTVGGVT